MVKSLWQNSWSGKTGHQLLMCCYIVYFIYKYTIIRKSKITGTGRKNSLPCVQRARAKLPDLFGCIRKWFFWVSVTIFSTLNFLQLHLSRFWRHLNSRSVNVRPLLPRKGARGMIIFTLLGTKLHLQFWLRASFVLGDFDVNFRTLFVDFLWFSIFLSLKDFRENCSKQFWRNFGQFLEFKMTIWGQD